MYAASIRGRTVRVIDSRNGATVANFTRTSRTPVSTTVDDDELAVSYDDGSVCIYNIRNGATIRTIG
jgi:hypothetical protein